MKILSVKLKDSGRRASITIKMPVYVDNPPPKWTALNCNALYIVFEFSAIQSIKIQTKSRYLKGDISIFKVKSDYIRIHPRDNVHLQIDGTIKLDIVAEVCTIRKIKGYYIN